MGVLGALLAAPSSHIKQLHGFESLNHSSLFGLILLDSLGPKFPPPFFIIYPPPKKG